MDILVTVPTGMGGVGRQNYSSGARLGLGWRMENYLCQVGGGSQGGKVGRRNRRQDKTPQEGQRINASEITMLRDVLVETWLSGMRMRTCVRA